MNVHKNQQKNSCKLAELKNYKKNGYFEKKGLKH